MVEELQGYLKALGQSHWKLALIIIGSSFISAFLVSIFLATMFFQTKTNEKKSKNVKQNLNNVEVHLAEGGVTLSEKELKAILQRNIFNSEGPAEDPDSRSDEESKKASEKPIKTDLPLKLLGIIYGGDQFHGIAIIQNTEKNSEPNSFMVGDILVENAIVREIHRDRVIFTRGERKEFIEMEKQEIVRSSRNIKKVEKAPTVDSENIPIATEPPPDSFKEPGFERKGHDIIVSQSFKDKLLTSDFAKVLQDAKATPNMVNGELKGFLLERIRKDSVYEKSGFQNGDIVEEINGLPLTDTAQAIKLLNSLRNAGDIEVVATRNGQRFTTVLNIK